MTKREKNNLPVERFKEDYKVYQPNPMLMVYDNMKNIWQARFLKAYQAKVRPSDPNSYWVKFSLEEFLEAVGVSKTPSVDKLKDMADSIRKTGFDFYEYRRKYGGEQIDPKRTKPVNLFEYFAIEGNKDEGYYVEARPTRTMEELLQRIAELGYVDYEVRNVLGFSSKRTIRFYEFLKRNEGMDVRVKVDELKIYLGLEQESYPDVKIFTRNIVKKSIEEINQETDIEVEWESLASKARGGKTLGYRFVVKSKPAQPKLVPPAKKKQEREQLNIDSQEKPVETPAASDSVNQIRDVHRQVRIDIVRSVVRTYDFTDDELEEVVVAVEQSGWWKSARAAFMGHPDEQEIAFREYVETQYAYTKSRSRSKTKDGFKKYLVGAVRKGYEEVEVFDPKPKAKVSQGTFDTREIFTANCRRTFGDDFDPDEMN